MIWMRGVTLTYETVRHWCLKFGQTYANELRRRRPRPGDKWRLDEKYPLSSTADRVQPTLRPYQQAFARQRWRRLRYFVQ